MPLRCLPAVRRPLLGGVALLAAACAAHAGCDAEVGRARAQTLVARCTEVSPATRPPCNLANACALIRAEIARGCRFLKEDAPGWCADE